MFFPRLCRFQTTRCLVYAALNLLGNIKIMVSLPGIVINGLDTCGTSSELWRRILISSYVDIITYLIIFPFERPKHHLCFSNGCCKRRIREKVIQGNINTKRWKTTILTKLLTTQTFTESVWLSWNRLPEDMVIVTLTKLFPEQP